MGAISSKGNYFYYDRSHYFTAEDVLKFVKLIKQKMRGKQWAVFWDNATIHRAKVVDEYLESKGIPVIRNLAYRPEFNGIESLWSS